MSNQCPFDQHKLCSCSHSSLEYPKSVYILNIFLRHKTWINASYTCYKQGKPITVNYIITIIIAEPESRSSLHVKSNPITRTRAGPSSQKKKQQFVHNSFWPNANVHFTQGHRTYDCNNIWSVVEFSPHAFGTNRRVIQIITSLPENAREPRLTVLAFMLQTPRVYTRHLRHPARSPLLCIKCTFESSKSTHQRESFGRRPTKSPQ